MRVIAIVGLSTLILCPARAQTIEELTGRFIGMTAVTGYEQAMADSLVHLLPGSERDRAGDVIVRLGTGTPLRLVACPMDEWGYVVGNIREDGYVTVRRVGQGAVPPLFDQGHAGHRVTIWGARGAVPAVAGIPSTHLQRGRPTGDQAPVTSDEFYLDLGAASASDVANMGIRILAPLAAEKAPHRYGTSLLAGPFAAQRASCAALAQVYLQSPRATGTVVLAFTVESRLRHRGLATIANGIGPFEGTLLLDYPFNDRFPLERQFGEAERLGTVERANLTTLYTGTRVETVDLAEVRATAERITAWIGVER